MNVSERHRHRIFFPPVLSKTLSRLIMEKLGSGCWMLSSAVVNSSTWVKALLLLGKDGEGLVPSKCCFTHETWTLRHHSCAPGSLLTKELSKPQIPGLTKQKKGDQASRELRGELQQAVA